MTQEHGSASETAKGQPRQELGIKYWNHGKDWFKKKKKKIVTRMGLLKTHTETLCSMVV